MKPQMCHKLRRTPGKTSAMDIANVAGPLLLGYLINCGFQGILCVQIRTYYVAFPKDRLVFKILVYLVFALETTQTIITTRDAYDTFVTAPRIGTSLENVRTLWFTFPVIGGLVAFIGQMFFAYRLKILSMSWIPPMLVTLFGLCGMVAAMATGAGVLELGTLSKLYVARNDITAGTWNAGSAACDIVISAYMFYYLSRQIRHSSHPSLRTRISRLIRLVVETGLLTATTAILNLLFVFAFRGGSYFSVPSAILAKLYANTMLLILNNRITIIGGRNDVEDHSQSNGGGSHWKWRLKQRHTKRSAGPEGRKTVLTEYWEDPAHGDHLAMTQTMGFGR